MPFYYFAEEKIPENFNDKNMAVKDYIIKDGKVLTPFSGKFPTYERATAYMKENGKFWQDRGVKLELLETDRNKDY